MGISQALSELSPVIEKELGRVLSLGELRRLITDQIVVDKGTRHNFKKEVTATMENYVLKLMERVFDKRKKQFDRCGRITLIGGGAYYISKHIPEEYKTLIEVAPHPEFANVRGYAYEAYWRQKRGVL
jgi:pantothenate kinase